MTSAPLSQSFDLLDRRIQRWIYNQGWPALRSAQEAAIGPVLAADSDVVICAATAAGKTEAAFLPICTRLLKDRQAAGPPTSVEVLYVSPLKALINDQWGRLDGLCEHLDIPVHRWHGDVNAGQKKRLISKPEGILLITPESLEALFMQRGPQMKTVLGGVRYVVIDEMHAFLGSVRGAQLQSLLHRLELTARRKIVVVALSATLGDVSQATHFVRPRTPDSVKVITDDSPGTELRLQLRGYERKRPPKPDAQVPDDETEASAIADHLLQTLRGSTNLVFAASKAELEKYTDRLQRRCESLGLPNEFHPHHGNLSRELREDVERLLREGRQPVTALCTSTLELGIDIGAVSSVTQMGTPPTVAALRQRLGRTGRRGDPAVLRLYITEKELDEKSPPLDTIRYRVVQSIAMLDLLFERWYEPVESAGLNLSTLIQQVLSTIAQLGGARAAELYDALCGPGPFSGMTKQMFGQLLRDLASHDLLVQTSDQLLLPGVRGEKLINHYSFYAAFSNADDFRVVVGGRTLGTISPDHLIQVGSLIILGGRRWSVQNVDTAKRVIDVVSAGGGRPPVFDPGNGPVVHAKVHEYMLRRYLSHDVPAYLDETAQRLLAEGRDFFRRWSLHQLPATRNGSDVLLFPWAGDRVHHTLGLLLGTYGLNSLREGPALNVRSTTIGDLTATLRALAEGPPPNAVELARTIKNKSNEKHDDYLGEDLASIGLAQRSLDIDGALQACQRLLTLLPTEDALPERPKLRSPAVFGLPVAELVDDETKIEETLFSVVDIETTGFSPRTGDRVVEIGVIRITGNGTVLERFGTLLNPERPMAATGIHGITDEDVRQAPTFRQIADDLALRLAGTVVVAHNASFDLSFLSAEFAKSGLEEPVSATACTLEMATQHLPHLTSHKLAACAEAEEIAFDQQHTALTDADVAAQLLSIWIGRSRGATTLGHLGIKAPSEPAAAGVLPSPKATLLPRTNGTRRPDPVPAATPVRSPQGQQYAYALARAIADQNATAETERELGLLGAELGLSPFEQGELREAATG